MCFTSDLHKDFIQVPAPAAGSQGVDPLLPDLGGEHRSEPVPPEPHRLVANLDAALMQQVLNVPKRQREPHIHHHGQTDDLGRGLEIPERKALGHPERLGDRPALLKNFLLTVPDNPITDQEALVINDYGMGFGMGFGWLWMIVILVLVGLAIAALIKYLRK